MLKLSSKYLASMSVVVYLLYAFFSDLIGVTFRAPIYRCSLWLFSIMLIIIATNSYRTFRMPKGMLIIIVVSLAFVLIRNQALKNHDYMVTVRWLFCFFFAILFVKKPESYRTTINSIVKIGFIHVIATYVFWLIPSLYSSMFHFWGYWPSGTSSGRLGYKAALTNNYSRNGIMLAIAYLAIFSIILSNTEKHRGKNKLFSVLFILALFATILTTKRAHLIFGILSIITVYYFCNPEKMGSRTFKLIILGVAGTACLVFFAQYIPALSTVFDRFSSLEGDSTLQSRFTFWRLAISMFKKNPIIGNGWFAFRYQYRVNLYDTSIRAARYELLDCHNVYIQLLAETGVTGLLFYLIFVTRVLMLTFTLLRHNRKEIENIGLYTPLIFSALMQVFYLLYSVTGNCLYDITSAFYFLAVAMTVGSYYRIKKSRG